ncbi:hypothetical protein KUCAC02_029499, partial [Chaenocephalus aceratus]
VEHGQSVRMAVGSKDPHHVQGAVQVQRSPVFKRNGADIHSDVLISVAQAILGGTATGPGLHQTISITVPASCQADQVIRLQGKGIRRMSSYSYGDHYVHLKIRVPKKLTRRQRSPLLSYAEEETDVEQQADEESTERPGRGRRVSRGMEVRLTGRVEAGRKAMDSWPLLSETVRRKK